MLIHVLSECDFARGTMPWKIGGNFEIVATKCEENWRECAIAVATYVWCEMVSDVVDYLGKEGMIWVLIVIITSTILLRVKYRKGTRMQNIVLSKEILSKVGCKIHDLELKVNILTYKMQYGTWPLPHQIYSLNPKKLQKIRMTLSNPGDHKSWINRVLLSPMKNSMCVPYPNMFASSETKLTNCSDINRKYTRHVEYNSRSTDYDSIETSKSTSDRSVNSDSQAADMHSLNASTGESDNFTLRDQNMRLLSSIPNETKSSRTLLIEKHLVSTISSTKRNPCQGFTDTVHKCKSFLKELRRDKHLHPSKCSSETSKAGSLRQSIASSARENGGASHDDQTTTTEREMNEIKCANRSSNSETMENAEEANVIPMSNDIATFSRDFCPIQPANDVQSSPETLYEVKRRLQSLHDVLQTYQDANRSSEHEKAKGEQRCGEMDAFTEAGHEDEDRRKTDIERDVEPKENPPERSMDCEYLNHSDGSSSSLSACSSHTSKTYRCPTQKSGSSQRCTARSPVETSDLPTSLTKLSDCERSSRFYSFPTLQSSDDRIACENTWNENETDACKRDVPYHACRSDTRIKLDVANADDPIHLRGRVPEAVPEDDTSIQDEISFKRFVKLLDNEEPRKCQENATVSQSENKAIGKYQKNVITYRSGDRTCENDNDRKEEGSTALLLQEALHFKQVLLKQVDSTELDRTENNIADKSPRDCNETQQREDNDHFPAMILDIKTEESVIDDDSRARTNQCYLHLEMKQRRDPSLQSEKLNGLTHCETEEENQDRIREISSKYFSITDFAIRDDDDDDDVNIGNSVLSSLKYPIYDKVVSIMIPMDAKRGDKIHTKNEDERPFHMDDAVARDIRIRRNSSENLKENEDTDDNVAGHSLTMRKLEDLILERIRNIRDYMDTFLQNQNKAISRVRRALQYHDGNGAMHALLQCSNEASQVISHKRLITISNRDDCIDQAVNSSSDSPEVLLKAWPNRRETFLKDDVSKYCSRENPEMFALGTPIKSEFSDEDNIPSETMIESEEKKTNPLFEHSSEEDATPTHGTNRISNLDDFHLTSGTVPSQEDDQQTNKRTTADTLNVDSEKNERQTQDTESSAMSSRYTFDSTETDAKIVEIVRERPPAILNGNLTSNSSSYFTNATASSMKIDDVSSKSILNLEQSRVVSIARAEQSQATDREGNFNENFPSTNVETNGSSSSHLEDSNFKTLLNSHFTSGESECDCSRDAKTTALNENSYDPDMSLALSSLNIKVERLQTDVYASNQERSDDISANVASYSLPKTESHLTRRLLRMYPRIKAKSDVSLTTDRRKTLNANSSPQRSLSFLTRHDSLAHIQRTGSLRQSRTNVRHNDQDEFAENKLQFANRSQSVISSQRASVRSCIPISKNRLEPIRRVRHQTLARSPTRGPLTVSCREKIFSKRQPMEEEGVIRKRSIPINRHSHVKEAALDVTELDMRKNAFAEDSERISKIDEAHRDDRVMYQEYPVKSSAIIDGEHSEKKRAHGSKSDTRIAERENATRKTVAVISILADADVRENYPANSFILKTENVCSATDFLGHKNKLWTVTIERTEKEVTAKPSIADTCTSMSEITLLKPN